MANPIKPDKQVVTTCAYCGVGCGFKAETHQGRIVRMIPWKEGKANHGHSCIKGRFAFDYYVSDDRVTTPLIRKSIDDPWTPVSWEKAIQHAASELRRVQAKYGTKSVGAVSSSRCTNEEIFLVQKLARAVMGNNNIDNCARICHSPTQFGLSATVGWGAASQHFDSIMQADVIMVVGANPAAGHQRRRPRQHLARDRPRETFQRSFRSRALRMGRVRTLGRFRLLRPVLAGGGRTRGRP